MDEPVVGLRCRLVKVVRPSDGGVYKPGLEGGIRRVRESLGRPLVTVDLDCGKTLTLLAGDIERA